MHYKSPPFVIFIYLISLSSHILVFVISFISLEQILMLLYCTSKTTNIKLSYRMRMNTDAVYFHGNLKLSF